MEESLGGKLLVASPKLLDPNFARTVVLVLSHDENGALGVVLNRALEVSVDDVLPGWAPLVEPPQVLFSGGPVDRTAALAVAKLLGSNEVPGFTRMTGSIGLLDLTREPHELPVDDIDGLRVFGGYAGWGAGQLEAEIEEEAWFVLDAEPGDPFRTEPEALWRDVLRRQQGRLAMFAFLPEDPRMN